MHVCLAPARSPGPRLKSIIISRVVLGYAALGAMLGGAPHLAAQTAELRLQILNGRTGRPVTNTHVMLWRDMGHVALSRDAAPQVTTDGEGYATIPANDSEFIVVYADGRQTCSKKFEHTFSLNDVRMRGLVSENSCNAHIHMFAQQGTLIVFVRDLTWYERMRH